MLTHRPGHVPSPFVDVQSALLEQKTVFTHSDGSELGDCDGYEQTSISVDPAGKSAVFTQQFARVSLLRHAEPSHLFDFRDRAAKASVTPLVTLHVLTAVGLIVAPLQLNCFVSPHV